MKAKRIKALSEIILAVAFICQTALYDYYNDESDKLTTLFQSQSLIDKGAELKEIKYFVAAFPDTAKTEEYKRVNLNMAGNKIVASQKIALYEVLDKGQATERLSRIQKSANSVKTFDDYMKFITVVNQEAVSSAELTNSLDDLNLCKRLSSYIFYGVYIIGFAMMIYAYKLEYYS